MTSSPSGSMSTSATTLRAYHFPEPVSIPSTPISSPSPGNSLPDSPLSDSISSLPSVSSSFFFSSAAASPPHPHSSQLDHSVSQGLIIPSLSLPTALRRSTPYGQTLGNLRVLVLVRRGADPSLIPALVLDDNEDIVDVGSWDETEYGRTMKASTDWVEHSDTGGLEKFEPLRNVEFIEFPVYDSETDLDELIDNVKSCLQNPFLSVSDILHPKHRTSSVLSNLLSSPNSPLYTALILLLPTSKLPDSSDLRLVVDLAPYIPVISLPILPKDGDGCLVEKPGRIQSPKVSCFKPRTLAALRAGLFRSPEIVAQLRSEAADRFMRWREVECAVADIFSIRNGALSPDISPSGYHNAQRSSPSSWDKARWESEWMPTFSVDVAKRLREGTITQRIKEFSQDETKFGYVPKTCPFAETVPSPVFGRNPMYDPLHLPSLLVFSISLLGPLRERFDGSLSFVWDALEQVQVRVALLGGFVVGLGVGLVIR
ncbi:hypothetical protein M378DRAFT_124543 [Amanita muscaria Koide BX008]|uniref:Uncharacterized protein n=1 Tax=Amanita muscaria (strain Koide BX008) TaxID=946122 RepID=A0A0C2XB53_AMAMK|nr:hypothetical protein M378DRAFT_124543 [Amanita muscaria Koide BX008]